MALHFDSCAPRRIGSQKEHFPHMHPKSHHTILKPLAGNTEEQNKYLRSSGISISDTLPSFPDLCTRFCWVQRVVFTLCVPIPVWVESWLQHKINHNHDAQTVQVMVWASMPMKNCWLALYFRRKKGNLERGVLYLDVKNTDNLCMLYSSQTPLSILEIFEELYFPSQIFSPEKNRQQYKISI